MQIERFENDLGDRSSRVVMKIEAAEITEKSEYNGETWLSTTKIQHKADSGR